MPWRVTRDWEDPEEAVRHLGVVVHHDYWEGDEDSEALVYNYAIYKPDYVDGVGRLEFEFSDGEETRPIERFDIGNLAHLVGMAASESCETRFNGELRMGERQTDHKPILRALIERGYIDQRGVHLDRIIPPDPAQVGLALEAA